MGGLLTVETVDGFAAAEALAGFAANVDRIGALAEAAAAVVAGLAAVVDLTAETVVLRIAGVAEMVVDDLVSPLVSGFLVAVVPVVLVLFSMAGFNAAVALGTVRGRGVGAALAGNGATLGFAVVAGTVVAVTDDDVGRLIGAGAAVEEAFAAFAASGFFVFEAGDAAAFLGTAAADPVVNRRPVAAVRAAAATVPATNTSGAIEDDSSGAEIRSIGT